MAALNINGLSTHVDELRVYLATNDIDILAINGTKLDESIMEGEVNICGYDIVPPDRKRGGGGVCFFVKNSINFSTRHDLNVDDLENLCVEIQNPRSKPFLVVTWYRPPDSLTGIFESFEILLRRLDSLNIEYHLLGDINCNLSVSLYDNDTRKLVSITDVYGLHQLINEPTRITETSQTLTDLIYTNCGQNCVFWRSTHRY